MSNRRKMNTGLFILAPLSINDCATDFPPKCCHLNSATPLWIRAMSWLTRNVVWWAWLITHYIIVGPSWPLLIIVFGQAVASFWQYVFWLAVPFAQRGNQFSALLFYERQISTLAFWFVDTPPSLGLFVVPRHWCIFVYLITYTCF